MKTLTAAIAGLALCFALLAGGPAAAAGGESSSTPKSAELAQAQAAIDKKDYQGALPLLQAAVVKTPDSADAWNLMGYAHRKLGIMDKSLVYYQKALAIDKNHLGALEYLGELYVETGRPEEAKAILKRLDAACSFICSEYDDLKRTMKAAKIID